MGYQIKLVGKKRIQAEKMLSEVCTLLDQNKITYALEGGTLLGLYREQRLLPWDSDLDLSILENEIPKIASLIDTLKSKSFRVRLRYFNNSNPPFKKNKLRIIKIRKRRFFGLLKGSVCLEIFVKFHHHNKVYWEVAGKTMAAPKIFYSSYKTIPFNHIHLSIPEDTEGYLTHKYGDWKTPIKDWEAATDEKSLVK